MYWDGPMRVSYLIFNDRRSESITGKHIYQQSRIVCEDITKPSSPRRRLVLNGREYCTKMSGMVYLRVKFTYGFHFIKSVRDPN